MTEACLHILIYAIVAATNVVLIVIFVSRMIRGHKSSIVRQKLDIENKVDDYGQHIDTAWQNANSNINFNKNLQWNYIYYIVLLYASTMAISSTYNKTFLSQLLLFIGANAIFHVGLYLTIDIQYQIIRERISWS